MAADLQTGVADEYVRLYAPTLQDIFFFYLGRTEKIDNNPDPVWKTKFVVSFSFEERQRLKFNVYDWDKGDAKTAKFTEKDLLGSTECLLAQIVSVPGKTFIAPLASEKKAKSKSKLFSIFSKKKKSKSKPHL